MEDILVRHIQPQDNAAMALIIRKALEEFGANKPGTVYYDESTDHLYELFQQEPLSEYFVAERNGILLGGAGIYPTDALPEGTCELVKMYLSPAARGMGLGRSMIATCMEAASAKGFEQIYLETMPEFKKSSNCLRKIRLQLPKRPHG